MVFTYGEQDLLPNKTNLRSTTKNTLTHVLQKNRIYFYCCGLLGIGCAFLFAWIAQYYTDYAYKPVRQVAEASTTGHGTNVIAGVALGMEATAMPVIVISIAIISAYWLGKMSGLQDDQGQACGGLKFSKVLYIVTFCLVNVLGH